MQISNKMGFLKIEKSQMFVKMCKNPPNRQTNKFSLVRVSLYIVEWEKFETHDIFAPKILYNKIISLVNRRLALCK